MCTSPRCHDVAGDAKTSYFLYVMMATVLLSFVLGLLWSCAVGCHVVSLSNSSLEPRLRRNSMVTCECRSVNRKLESTISGSLFFSGTRLVFVDLLCVVSWC